ncbi:MAG: hemolysin family protein [Acidimicrobiales bacterium]
MILATGFFVAAEFAFVAVDRNRVERDAAAGQRAARVVEKIIRHLSFHLSGAQLGITITSIVLGFIAQPTVAVVIEPALRPLLGDRGARGVALAIALVVVTVVAMVVGELVPKNLSVARPEHMAYLLGRPAAIYGTIFGPIIRFLNGAANWTVRRLGIEPKEELTAVRSLEELELLIRSSGEEGSLEPEAFRLLNRTLRFRQKTAADALVPRTAVTAVTPDAPIADLVLVAIETGYSRFPVCRNRDLDDLVGVVHVKDVYRLAPDDRIDTKVAAIMTDPFVVPETKDLASLLVELRQSGSHLAVVVDEYGGTAGIITLEDVVEEIVGDIADEHDRGEAPFTTVRPTGESLLPGTLHPDEVLDATGFAMPEGDYETLAGFVLDRLGHIPKPGEGVEVDGWRVEVVEMDRLRVAVVRLVAPQPQPEPDEAATGAATEAAAQP